jgi:hypothetical protein
MVKVESGKEGVKQWVFKVYFNFNLKKKKKKKKVGAGKIY